MQHWMILPYARWSCGESPGSPKNYPQTESESALVSLVLLGHGRPCRQRLGSLPRPAGHLLRPSSRSVAGGVLNGLGAWTSFRALESGGKASIVISLISLYPLLTVVLAVLCSRAPHRMQTLGAVTAISAAILLSLESPQNTAAK